MTQVSQPKVSVSILAGTPTIDNTAQRVLYVGEQGSGSTIATGSLVKNIQIGEADTFFEDYSMLAHMINDGRKVNEVTQFDAICLDSSGTGAAATGTFDFTGAAATVNGSISCVVGSSEDYTFSVDVAETDTPTDVALALETLVNASTVPATALAAVGTVTITAAHTGLLGNTIGLSFTGAVGGITTAITAMTGGTGGPDLTGVFDILADRRYQGIVWPYYFDTDTITDFLDARFNVDNKVLDGVGITNSADTYANHLAALALLNSQSLTYFCDKTTDEDAFKGPAQEAFIWSGPSLFGAIRSLRLTDGASISDVVTATYGALDAFGGAALASKPYFNTPMNDLPIIGTGRGWTDTEIEGLHDAGGSVIGNNSAGNTSLVGEVVTTYKNDPAGNPDISFKYLNYVDTSSGCREYFSNNLRARFQQSRLTEGDVIGGRDMANALTIEAYCVKLFQDLTGSDFVLLEAGEAALNFFKDNISVTIDKATGTATITMIVPLVTQLRTINATMQIAFSTTG